MKLAQAPYRRNRHSASGDEGEECGTRTAPWRWPMTTDQAEPEPARGWWVAV